MSERIVTNATVEAIRRGYYGLTIREPGDVFLFSGVLGSWMRIIKDGALDHDADGAKGGSLLAAADGLEEMRADARALGIDVDNRWGAKRLKTEIDKALSK